MCYNIRRMKRWLLIATLLGCSGGEAAAPVTAAPESDTAVEEDTAAADAPEPEKCGHAEGDVFCDFELMGYARVGETTGVATSTPYGSHRLTDVLAKSAVKYVYVFASAYW